MEHHFHKGGTLTKLPKMEYFDGSHYMCIFSSTYVERVSTYLPINHKLLKIVMAKMKSGFFGESCVYCQSYPNKIRFVLIYKKSGDYCSLAVAHTF